MRRGIRVFLGLRAAAAALGVLLGPACRPTAPVRAVDFPLPDVQLVDQDGRPVRFASHFQPQDPVVVTFIDTTCTTVCAPVATAFATLQAELGQTSGKVRLVAISLMPEQDTPALMKDYLRRFRARPGWEFLTGDPEDLRRIRKVFNQHVPGEGPSMPLSFIRSPRDGRWTRLAGPRSPADYVAVCRKEGIL